MTVPGVRARVRAQMIEEIKAAAHRHLATDGANLSLRAVARDLGMAPSALYRYFASRDDLLTALIVDAYNAVGEAAEQAAQAAEQAAQGAERAAQGAEDPLARWLAVTSAVRAWALAQPHRWALIYGSPVPGYQAPQDTIAPAARLLLLIGQILLDAHRAGRLAPSAEPLTGRYVEELARVAHALGPDTPVRVVAGTIMAFFQLCGAISGELFGQLNNGIEEDRQGFFAYQMRGAARLAGLIS